MIFRFYDVDSGRVLIDDHDVQSVTQSSLRSRIGVVPQDTVLFNDTISYNIKYGCPDATQLEVEEAARLAQIHQKIVEFPDKYDTKVGERGMRLSGGEKQRVSIARTILKNPSIILLDEATSALDNSTERIIKESLQNLSHGRTSFTIAHRLQTIIDSDVILVLDGGRIVERGTHKELLSAGNGKGKGKDGQGVYYKLWMEQEEKEKKMEEEISLVEVVVGDKVIKPL